MSARKKMKPTDIHLHADSPALRAALEDSELSGCPFCGLAMGVNRRLEMIVHSVPVCARYQRTLHGLPSFAAAVAVLESKAVFA